MTLNLPNTDNLIVAVDTETSGLHPDSGARLSIVSLAWDGGSLAIPFDQGWSTWLGDKDVQTKKAVGDNLFEHLYPNQQLSEWNQLTDWLRRQCLVFHNAKFDLHMFRVGLRGLPATGVDLAPAFHWDVMVINPLLWPNARVGLKPTAARLWGLQETAAQRSLGVWKSRFLPAASGGRYDVIPSDLILPYADQDAVLTLRLYHVQQALIAEGLVTTEAVDRAIDLVLVLYYMEYFGIGFDVVGAQIADDYLYRMEQSQRKAVAALVKDPNPTEHTMRKYWFHTLGVEHDDESVSAEVVRKLVAQQVPAAQEWQDYAKTQNARSMWYSNWWRMCGADGRLRASYRQVKSEADLRNNAGSQMKGTRSSRLAVERVQLQAIPHDYQLPPGVRTVRSLFIPKSGHSLWEVDVSQAEMRAVAGLAKCKSLIDQFSRGADAHDATCELVFRVDRDSPKWEFYRNIAKRLNFAIVYGAGIATLIDQVYKFTGAVVTEAEVKKWWADAKLAMPEVFSLSRSLQSRAERTREVPLVGGQTRHLSELEFTHKAMNAQVQGSVAIAMADAMIEVHATHGPGLMLLQIHDSIVLEPPTEQEEVLVADVQRIITETFERLFNAPFRTDAKRWK